LVRAIRRTHRGYQTYGRTALDTERAQAREQTVFDLTSHLTDHGPTLLSRLAPHPTQAKFRAARRTLQSAHPGDRTLQADLRKIRFNPAGPLKPEELALAVVMATDTFRAEIAQSSTASRKEKKRLRSHAWTALNSSLSAVDLALLAAAHPGVEALRQTASGSLR